MSGEMRGSRVADALNRGIPVLKVATLRREISFENEEASLVAFATTLPTIEQYMAEELGRRLLKDGLIKVEEEKLDGTGNVRVTLRLVGVDTDKLDILEDCDG